MLQFVDYVLRFLVCRNRFSIQNSVDSTPELSEKACMGSIQRFEKPYIATVSELFRNLFGTVLELSLYLFGTFPELACLYGSYDVPISFLCVSL